MNISKLMKAAVKGWLRRRGFEFCNLRNQIARQNVVRAIATEFVKTMPKLSLELGSGPIKGKDGWVTIDWCEGADICWDLNAPLPFPDDSVTRIYSSHTLEHFFYRDLIRLLTECCRVLKPGGYISVCVPDASIYIRAYMATDIFDRRYFIYEPAIVSNLKMDRINYIAYMDGHHRFMFDAENLGRVLAEAGFSDVQSREFDPALDIPERKYESIYAIGFKPNGKSTHLSCD